MKNNLNNVINKLFKKASQNNDKRIRKAQTQIERESKPESDDSSPYFPEDIPSIFFGHFGGMASGWRYRMRPSDYDLCAPYYPEPAMNEANYTEDKQEKK